jgi:hypothetical protein
LASLSQASEVTNSTVGAAVGSIMATIITHHMTEIANAYVGLHAGSIGIICPPPMSIISISMAPPSNR